MFKTKLVPEDIVTHEEQLVSDMISAASPLVAGYLKFQPRERRLRLNGLQQILDDLMPRLESALFQKLFAWVSAQAEDVAGTCRVCCTRNRRETKPVKVKLKRFSTVVPVVRFRCRTCNTSDCPVRDWLGLQSGMTTASLDRALIALAIEMSFGRSAKQMEEQHGHSLDRTLVERRTYAVGKEAIEFLGDRRGAQREKVMDAVGHRPGVERVFVQVDGGGVPVGTLVRPSPDETTERTPVRNLPKGRRPKTKREVRVSMAWQEGVVVAKAVDLHIAPHNHTEVSGDRLYCAALEAGAGDNTHIHLTCDMASWHRKQFEEQFSAQESRSLCADFFHALEYISDAGRCFPLSADERRQWLAVQASRLKNGERDAIVEAFAGHSCTPTSRCVTTDRDECAVRAARRYLKKFGQYMDYPHFRDEGLPIGSGAVEGRIRHLVRRRLDIPGDWREANLHPVLALISIRESGLWETFWEWLDKRDVRRFYGRLRGEGLTKFRGKLSRPPKLGQATERTGIDEPFNFHEELSMPAIH